MKTQIFASLILLVGVTSTATANAGGYVCQAQCAAVNFRASQVHILKPVTQSADLSREDITATQGMCEQEALGYACDAMLVTALRYFHESSSSLHEHERATRETEVRENRYWRQMQVRSEWNESKQEHEHEVTDIEPEFASAKENCHYDASIPKGTLPYYFGTSPLLP